MKKFSSIAAGIIIGVILAWILSSVVPVISNSVSSWTTNELLTVITLIGVLVAFSVPFIDNALQDYKHKHSLQTVYKIDVTVQNLENNYVHVSATIENVGDTIIETDISNLYIDQGEKTVLTNDRNSSASGAYFFGFPFIFEHRGDVDGRPDCVLCRKCFKDHNYNYPDELVNKDDCLVRTHKQLDHLSNKSIKYIMPKEKFSEDVIIQFSKAGVYRATLFVGIKGDADCSCATKQFYIANDLPQHEKIVTAEVPTR